MKNEPEFVEWLRRQAGVARSGLVLGIGDDCAVFRPRAGEDLVFTTDQFIENVHFTRAASAAKLGARALARSLSDIAAMGAVPRFCLVSLAIPKDTKDVWIKTFFRGLLKLAAAHKTMLAGGDLAHDEKIHADVMVCGVVYQGKALCRDGARAGDEIYVSGVLGKGWERLIHPRIALGRQLVGRATSCIDLSDGLSLDLRRLCVASGVAAELESVPVAKGSTVERALHLGEDYELLFTLPPGKRAPAGTTRIGKIVRGAAGVIWLKGEVVEPGGFDHFRG